MSSSATSEPQSLGHQFRRTTPSYVINNDSFTHNNDEPATSNLPEISTETKTLMPLAGNKTDNNETYNLYIL